MGQRQLCIRLVTCSISVLTLNRLCAPLLPPQVETKDPWGCVDCDKGGVVLSERADKAVDSGRDVMFHPPVDGGQNGGGPLVGVKQAWSREGVSEAPLHHGSPGSGHKGHQSIQEVHKSEPEVHKNESEVHKNESEVPKSEREEQKVPPAANDMAVEDIEECLNESLPINSLRRPQDVFLTPEPAQAEVNYMCSKLCVHTCICDVCMICVSSRCKNVL